MARPVLITVKHGLVVFAVAMGLLVGPLCGDRLAIAESDRFFDAVTDMPLMPGLTEDADESVVFDKPTGRIVTLVANGNVAPKAVLDYYDRALPQLGWSSTGRGSFSRDGEILVIGFVEGPGNLTVRMRLSPE